MKTNQHLLRLGALALAIAAANAAHAEQTQQNEQLEDLQVWGTEVKASSLKMNEDSFAIKQADHVSDLLRTIPGVDVGGAHSLNQRITIRSMDDKDLKITIDGSTQNTYMYHHMGNLQIHADILKSVDVEIGTNSVVNGGLGGAVRFETKTADQLLEPGKDFGARIQANTSSNGSDGWSLIGYGKLADSFDYLLYHNVVNGDDYKVGGGKIKNEFGEEVEDTNGEVRGLDGEVTDTLVKFGWDITAEQRIAISYEAYVDDGDYSYRPDMGLATDLAISEALDAPLLWPTEFTRDTLTLSYDAQLGETYLKATLFDNQSDLERDETGYKTSTAFVRGQPVAEWAATIEGGADNTGLNVLAETDANQHVLTYGLEYIKYETEYRAVYLIGTVDSNSEEAITTSLFLQDRIQINDAVAVIPGIRYDEYDIESTLVTETFSDITGALAIEYAVQPSLLLKLSSTELFQAPEIGEAFIGAGLFDYPNAEIEAESGFNHEFSLAFEDAVLGADEFATGFTLFRTEIDNYIHDYAPPPADSGVREWKDNVGDMVIDGFEAYVGYHIG
ncbi:MAG: TonB-dependent receptor, partial [Pseudomonadales bacterium]|nr:TonB-dependent receptor [Pseudomonadales bacterium]